jgi:hypothetical protein
MERQERFRAARDRSNVHGLAIWVVVLAAACGTVAAGEVQFRRGDIHSDGRVSLTDAVVLARWLGLAGPAPGCELAADVDANGSLNISDVVGLLRFLYEGGDEPRAPFPGCGTATSGGTGLTCATGTICAGQIPAEPGRFRIFVSVTPDATVPTEGELRLPVLAGRTVELPFFVLLSGETSTGRGADGWSIGLVVETEIPDATMTSVTTAGTTAAQVGSDSAGLVSRGYSFAERVSDRAAASAVVLSLLEPRTLPPGSKELSSLILRGTLRLTAPAAGEETGILVRPGSSVDGSGEEIELEVSADGRPYAPDVSPLRVRLVALESLPFIRGDANHDGNVDISDAVFKLNWLFLGRAGPACADAADSNDDGRLDISDAIETLRCAFIAAGCPRPPFPECGPDPTRDALGCDALGPNCS